MKIQRTPLIGQRAGSSFRSMRQLLEDIKLRKQQISINNRRNRIRNSKGENFQQYWERVKKTGNLGASINPLNWLIETETELAYAKEYKRMTKRELGIALIELSNIIAKYFPLQDKVNPLREFVDRLDDFTFNNLYFANIPAHLQTAKAFLNKQIGEKSSDEKILKTKKAVEIYERTKVLVFEIVNRWNRT